MARGWKEPEPVLQQIVQIGGSSSLIYLICHFIFLICKRKKKIVLVYKTIAKHK